MSTKRIALAVLVVLAMSSLLRPHSAQAQNSCDVLVLDEAGVFGSKFEQVQTEAQKLVNTGADVRIRTIKTFGSAGNLDNYEKQVERECASWRAQDGGRKNNLVVIMAATNDRKTGMYYGGEWKATLDPQWTRIQTGLMNPRFRDGDFAGGFISGIHEVTRLLDLKVNPPTPAPAPQAPIVVIPPREETPPPPPPDLSGLWRALSLLIVGLIAFGTLGLIVIAVILIVSKAEKKRISQQKARVAKEAADAKILELTQRLSEANLSLQIAESTVSEQDAQPVRAAYARAENLLDHAIRDFGNRGQAAGDPTRPGLSVGEYAEIEDAYAAILERLGDAEELIASVETQTKTLGQLAAETNRSLDAVQQAVAQAQGRIADVAMQGYDVSRSTATLSQAQHLVDEAEKAVGQKQYKNAQSLLQQAEQQVQAAVEAAESLPDEHRRFQAAVSALPGRIERAEAAVRAGRELFGQISSQYAQTSWQSVRGNGTEAEKRVTWSQSQLPALQKAAQSHNPSDWNQELLVQVSQRLDEVESLMRSISALSTNLAAAKQAASGEVQAARDDIAQARSYIQGHEADVRDDLERSLDAAGRVLSAADAELAKPLPDYLAVVKNARQANHTADEILAEARSEVEAAERLRAKAATAVREAQAAVSRAKEYIEDHSPDVQRTAERELDEAQELLASAERTVVLTARIDQAQKAEEKADSAYSRAQRDFEEAEDDRRSSSSIFVIGGGSSGSSSSEGSSYHSSDDGGSSSWGSSSGGGGSTDWGSSSGGGGSSSFGSSDGGGGSTGW